MAYNCHFGEQRSMQGEDFVFRKRFFQNDIQGQKKNTSQTKQHTRSSHLDTIVGLVLGWVLPERQSSATWVVCLCVFFGAYTWKFRSDLRELSITGSFQRSFRGIPSVKRLIIIRYSKATSLSVHSQRIMKFIRSTVCQSARVYSCKWLFLVAPKFSKSRRHSFRFHYLWASGLGTSSRHCGGPPDQTRKLYCTFFNWGLLWSDHFSSMGEIKRPKWGNLIYERGDRQLTNWLAGWLAGAGQVCHWQSACGRRASYRVRNDEPTQSAAVIRRDPPVVLSAR